MGVTSFSVLLLDKIIDEYNPKNVGEYGSQNLYLNGEPLPAPFANIYYESKGIEYTCFDLSKKNNCLHYDLTYLLPDKFNEKYDLVTDFGCTEHYARDGKHHVEGFYNSWVNKHQILKLGGVMVNENPESNSWPFHGVNYYTENFYRQLCMYAGYEILNLGRNAAMSNFVDGWNIHAVLKKISNKFPTLEEFKTLDLKQS